MAYKGNLLLLTDLAQRERSLLQEGLSYAAVAHLTSEKIGTIKERNRLVYRVDIYDAFRKRIEREGLPQNLRVRDDFGYYFTGLFDGEGCFDIYHRTRDIGSSIVPEFRLGIQIQLRDDDAEVLRYVHQNLGGTFRLAKRSVAHWRLESVKELAEVVVPLFAKYPLKSKKRSEYQIWSRLVIARYVATLGGETMRGGGTFDADTFIAGMNAIRRARRYADRSRIVEVAGSLAE